MFRTYEFDVKKLLSRARTRSRSSSIPCSPSSVQGGPAQAADLGLPGLCLCAEGAVQLRLGLGADADHLRHLAEDRAGGVRCRALEDVAILQDHSQTGQGHAGDRRDGRPGAAGGSLREGDRPPRLAERGVGDGRRSETAAARPRFRLPNPSSGGRPAWAGSRSMT